ncbi:MAG TPA: hypothetical protein VGR35_17885 [Tepidisphaeraceae bacterium]|nr:hypothetical protein [Tepidisphaeraceae bacterium]
MPLRSHADRPRFYHARAARRALTVRRGAGRGAAGRKGGLRRGEIFSSSSPREPRNRVRSPVIGSTGGPQEPTPGPRARAKFGPPGAMTTVVADGKPEPKPAPANAPREKTSREKTSREKTVREKHK